MRRAVAWVLGAALVGWQVFAVHAWGAEQVQGRVYTVTAIVSVLFIVLYSRDPWWRSLFGRSLMLLAVAVFLYGLSVVLFRFVGPDYFGRDALLVVAADATLAAMALRTWVLWVAQKRDRRDKGAGS